jgi:tetratricopeptide (TPR) repeat protein
MSSETHTLVRRRTLLRGLAGSGAALSIGGCADPAAALAEGQRLATRAREFVAFGSLQQAVQAADRAIELAPGDNGVLETWVHATGMKVLEGGGGEAEATAFVYQAWRRGARGAALAFSTLAHAVAVGNDRYAKNLLEQHEQQGVVADGPLHFASGAALDLLCSREAEGRFTASRAAWEGSVWPTMRRARTRLFHAGSSDAAEDVRECPGLMGDVLRVAGERLLGKVARLDATPLDHVADLPRSLRAIAYTLMADAGTQVPSEIMLNDVDTPLAAMLCGDLSTRVRDLAAAQSALEKACALRSELEPAREKLVRVHLLRGDLEGAKTAADRALGSDARTLVEAVDAYERRDVTALKRQLGDDPSGHVWACAPAALDVARLVEPDSKKLAPQQRADLLAGVTRSLATLTSQAKDVPWADVVLLDAARLCGDATLEKRVLEGWTEASPSRDRRRR